MIQLYTAPLAARVPVECVEWGGKRLDMNLVLFN